MTLYSPSLPEPLRLPGTPPPVCRRGPRDPHFTGRDDELEQVGELLATERVLVVDGDGLERSGKSAFALEYCHRFGQRYTMIWWFDCRAEDGLDAQVDAFRKQAGDAAGTERWWLSVYDGVRSAADLDGHLPDGPAHVLLTSHGAHGPRDRGVPGVRTFPLGPLTLAESIILLMRKAPELDPARAKRLAEAVGHRPALLSELGDLLLGKPDIDVDTCLALMRLGRRMPALGATVPPPRRPPPDEPRPPGEQPVVAERPSPPKVEMAYKTQLVNALEEVQPLSDQLSEWVAEIEDMFGKLGVRRSAPRATLVNMTNRALRHEDARMLEAMLEALRLVVPENEPGVSRVAELIDQIKRIRYP
ncbi:hypothetical protein SAMN05443665_104117 [Actinomadura meyerae]|uniref:Uncharacterized protein n=1 Tax=Actinomadura meyerae TaxID=240840 RepID=A0A239NGH2_9ACTN|nr:hypothetical protein [Actinomadura meyerae]SNT53991.1 hypothetical protein SAMN05443665_104117 [Actinomadura meyerae]